MFPLIVVSRTVSRVMSRTIIYLGLLLPAASSDLPGNGQGTHSSLFVLLRMGFTQPLLLPEVRWSLTPPFHPYRPKPAVYFLLHWPGSHLHRTLSGILPCEARTFLTPACGAAIVYPTYNTEILALKLSICNRVHFCFSLCKIGAKTLY